jgi:amino acid transporter
LFSSLNFAAVVIMLTAMGAAMGAMAYITASQAAAETDPNLRRNLARLAWMSLTLLLILVVVLTWTIIRHISARRSGNVTKPAPTPCIDAWKLAGRRFRLSADQEAEAQQLEDELGNENPPDEDPGKEGKQP